MVPYSVLDYYDLHLYYDPAAGDLDSITAADVPVMIGEFGQAIGAGTPARQSRYNAVKAVCERTVTGRHVAGAMAWVMYDQVPDAGSDNERYGLCDNDGNVRSDVLSIFQSFPYTPTP
jgi:hypothetical protein